MRYVLFAVCLAQTEEDHHTNITQPLIITMILTNFFFSSLTLQQVKQQHQAAGQEVD